MINIKDISKKLIWVAIIAVGVVIDQLTKLWTVNVLKPIGDIPLIEGVLHLHYATNTGGAWSILAGKMTFFIIVTVIALAAGAYFLFFYKKINDWMYFVSLSLIIGGTIGNFIDRLKAGEVIDMIYFKIINFPVFNFADIMLTVGCGLLVCFVLFRWEDGDGKKSKSNPNNSEK